MNVPAQPHLSVSTWALHRALGLTYPDAPGGDGRPEATPTYGSGSVSLLDVPARIAALGIRTLELCHFHLPRRDPAYLNELRAALDDAGVELFSLLIDHGDLTHPEHHARDRDWIGGWVDTAGALGAKRARVIAGKAAYSPEALDLSRRGLSRLAERGAAQGVRVMTENWFALLSRPEPLHALLDRLEGRVGLCADFGNWSGPSKYDDLASILPRAESCHAKSHFTDPAQIDMDDFGRCLDLARDSGFTGPYTLVYGGSGEDDWHGIALQRDAIRSRRAA